VPSGRTSTLRVELISASARTACVFGDTLQKSGERAGAVEAYRTSLRLEPNGKNAESARLGLKEPHAASAAK
jgi:predicted TPR repeat methyltransferase